MDPKMIEMQNLRVLNDYLNQTIDVLSRQPRFGQTTPSPMGFSPFGPVPNPAIPGTGTDTVYGPWFGNTMFPHPTFGATPFTGTPMYGGMEGFTPRSFSPFTPGFTGQFAPTGFGWQQPWQQPWQQQAWHPMTEVTRQAQLNQALAARQSVLEAMCRACGIPV